MKKTNISVGIACLIMSSSFVALAGGPVCINCDKLTAMHLKPPTRVFFHQTPAVNTSNSHARGPASTNFFKHTAMHLKPPTPVVNTSDSHAWTIYMNVNGALSTRTGKFNETGTPAVKQNAWTLGGGVNIGIAGKLTNQVNAFTQLSVDQFANETNPTGDKPGFRFAAETNSKTSKNNDVMLDKAYVNWNSASRSMVVQAGDMGMIDMSTFTQSNLNAWSPNTMGFDINSVTALFGPSKSTFMTIRAATNGSTVANLNTLNERGAGFGYHGFGHLYATAMYSVIPAEATTVTTKSGIFGKNSAQDIQAQLAWKTNNWVAAVNYLGNRWTGVNQKRSPGFNVQGAYRLGKFVFTGQYTRFNAKTTTPETKFTAFGAGVSYNLDLFGFNHTFQVNWLNNNNGKGLKKKSNTFQVNDIVPIFNKHFNMIPFFITTNNKGGETTKLKCTQYGVLFQGLWSVNV